MPKKLLATVAVISEAGAILKKDKLSALNGLWTCMGLFFLNFPIPRDYFFPVKNNMHTNTVCVCVCLVWTDLMFVWSVCVHTDMHTLPHTWEEGETETKSLDLL